MYVCLCRGITDTTIKAAIYDGATSVGQLRKTIGVASQCGKCSSLTQELLQETLQDVSLNTASAQFYSAA